MQISIKSFFKNKWVRIILATVATLIVALMLLMQWLMSFAPTQEERQKLKATLSSDISYLNQPIKEQRGKILAVVTSAKTMGESGKKTGYELTELARAYWVFTANGFEVDIASPEGGEPPVVIDGDDMGQYDYAFLNSEIAQNKVRNSLTIDAVNPKEYEAVYFVGGKGAMFDFPDNKDVQSIVRTMYEDGKVISAVCHGPAALVNVKLNDDSYLVNDTKISAFTNEEELFLIPDAKTVFPFLLQSKLTERGANFKAGYTYLENVVWDGKVITGQNPWSVWTLAENVISELGYTPKARPITGEENSVELLIAYENGGYEAAKRIVETDKTYQPLLVLMHGIVAGMKMEIGKALDLMNLAKQVAG